MFLFDYLICYDAAVATDEDVPPSIKPVLLVLGVEVGESVEVFVAADAFFAWGGIRVAFRAGFIASSKIKKSSFNSIHPTPNFHSEVCILFIGYLLLSGRIGNMLLPNYRDSQVDTHNFNINSRNDANVSSFTNIDVKAALYP